MNEYLKAIDKVLDNDLTYLTAEDFRGYLCEKIPGLMQFVAYELDIKINSFNYLLCRHLIHKEHFLKQLKNTMITKWEKGEWIK